MKKIGRSIKKIFKTENSVSIQVGPLKQKIYTGYINRDMHEQLYNINRIQKRA